MKSCYSIRTHSVLALWWLLPIFMGIGLTAQAQPQTFITKYGPLVDSLEIAYGIPASLMLGVSIIESGSGTSRNCKLLNNFFGVKGKNNLLVTSGIRSAYKQYASDTASFVDFCGIVSRKKAYPSLKGDKNVQRWVAALSKSGYSEAPAAWESLINGAIRTYQLDKRNLPKEL